MGDGSKKMGEEKREMCPWCNVLVPKGKMDEHNRTLAHIRTKAEKRGAAFMQRVEADVKRDMQLEGRVVRNGY